MRVLLAIVFLFISLACNAQESKQLWLDYNHSYQFNEQVKAAQDLDVRFIKNTIGEDATQVLIRQEIRLKVNQKINLRAGFAWNTIKANNKALADELRPHIGFAFATKLSSRFRYTHLLRTELRLINSTYGGFRFRYQAKINLQLNSTDAKHSFDALFHPELFSRISNTNNQLFSTVRVNVGLAYSITPKIRIEQHVIYQAYKHEFDFLYPQSHLIARTRIFYRWN